MANVQLGRMTVDFDGRDEFVVFLIGMRFNKVWKVHQWLPITRSFPRMVAELEQHPELGYLGGNLWFGRTLISVQYWESVEKLNAYASAKEHEHLPAMRDFFRNVGDSGDVGIWHETYRVRRGDFESIYGNMPPFGLGKVFGTTPATGQRERAKERMQDPVPTA